MYIHTYICLSFAMQWWAQKLKVKCHKEKKSCENVDTDVQVARCALFHLFIFGIILLH